MNGSWVSSSAPVLSAEANSELSSILRMVYRYDSTYILKGEQYIYGKHGEMRKAKLFAGI